jgi:hypothetical protein
VVLCDQRLSGVWLPSGVHQASQLSGLMLSVQQKLLAGAGSWRIGLADGVERMGSGLGEETGAEQFASDRVPAPGRRGYRESG